MSISVSLQVEGARVLVVGGGPVAERKVAALLRAGARLTLISPAVTPGLRALASEGRIEWLERAYRPGDQAGAMLVVSCTGNPAVDGAVAAEANGEGRLISVSGDPVRGNLSFMAEVRRGPVTVALATGGASPALAARLRREVEQAIGPEYGALAELLGEVRRQVRETTHLSQAERAALYEGIVQGPALDLLRAGREAEARNLIADEVARRLQRTEG